MKYSNELKVGLAIVAAVVTFVFGFRFFQDLPLFGDSYELTTRLDRAEGLVAGNAVRINGVKVGSVQRVVLSEGQAAVDVAFRLNEDVTVPQGSQAQVNGVSALGGVQLALQPGPPANPPIPPGGHVPAGTAGSGGLGELTERAPQLARSADTLLASATTAMQSANATFEGAARLVSGPDSDLRRTMAALRRSTASLEQALTTQDGRLNNVLANAEATTGSLRRFTDENTDSLGLAVSRLNGALSKLNANLAALETTTGRLDVITARIEGGDGTLGRLVNDPELYVRLDSTAAHLSGVLRDFQENPERYLDELTLVEIF